MPRKRTGNIQDRGTSFRIRYTDINGIRQHETYSTLEEAEDQLTIRLGQLAEGQPVTSKPNTVLFGELADDVVTDYEVNGFRSVDDIETRFRLHLVPFFGGRKVSQITTSMIQAYILKRRDDGAKTGTIKRELEAMRHAFKLAIKGRKLLHAPHVPMPREDNVRTGFFTREEVDRLCKFLPGPLASMVRFGFLTGWRLGEIRQLEWRSVDFARGEIRLDPGKTKNREGRIFPLTAELRTILAAIHAAEMARLDKMKPKITATSSAFLSMRVFPAAEFRKTWKTACHKAGLPCVVAPVKKHGKPGAVRVIKATRTFHDLRRSFAREMDRLGVRQGAIMKLGGWKTDSVFRRYNIVSDGDLRDALDKIENRIGPELGQKRAFRSRKRRKPK